MPEMDPAEKRLLDRMMDYRPKVVPKENVREEYVPKSEQTFKPKAGRSMADIAHRIWVDVASGKEPEQSKLWPFDEEVQKLWDRMSARVAVAHAEGLMDDIPFDS